MFTGPNIRTRKNLNVKKKNYQRSARRANRRNKYRTKLYKYIRTNIIIVLVVYSRPSSSPPHTHIHTHTHEQTHSYTNARHENDAINCTVYGRKLSVGMRLVSKDDRRRGKIISSPIQSPRARRTPKSCPWSREPRASRSRKKKML
jgi:hypothetical protein